MKRIMCIFTAVMMLQSVTACGYAGQEAKTEDIFRPALDTSGKCHINVAGGYDNFEALETEFDRFNEYYPKVEMNYTKIDNYNNSIATVLNGNDAPNIFLSFSWMSHQ